MEVLNGGRGNLQCPMSVIFIPTSSKNLLKSGEEEVMTAFLEPFVREMESALIDGFQVRYNFPPELICEGLSVLSRIRESKLRANLMYWTGDHPAQTKVAEFKLSGYNACHRHKNVTEKLDGSKVFYPNNRWQAHDPPPFQKIETIHEEALSFQTRASSSRSRRATFITSFSKLWQLYEICGFNLCLDLVYDSMHILPLNIFKSFVEQLVSKGEALAIDEALDEISIHRPKRLGAK